MPAIKNILYSSHFAQALKHISPEQKKVLAEREAMFKTNCFNPRLKTHKLKGRLKGCWSFSLTYSERVLFEFIDSETVGFIGIGDHAIYQ